MTGSYPVSGAMEVRETVRLVEAIAVGDCEAEGVFFRYFAPKVRTMLTIRLRNPDLARDLQQDVMIEALCALRKGQLRETEKLAAFVAGITRNVLNGHFRGQSRIPLLEELPDEIPAMVQDDSASSAESRERRQIADRAIATLDTIDRSILQMTLVDDLKPGVIAERLGLSSQVVRQRKLRATRRVVEFVRQLSQSAQNLHLKTGEL